LNSAPASDWQLPVPAPLPVAASVGSGDPASMVALPGRRGIEGRVQMAAFKLAAGISA
jgi:hypothetical protein